MIEEHVTGELRFLEDVRGNKRLQWQWKVYVVDDETGVVMDESLEWRDVPLVKEEE